MKTLEKTNKGGRGLRGGRDLEGKGFPKSPRCAGKKTNKHKKGRWSERQRVSRESAYRGERVGVLKKTCANEQALDSFKRGEVCVGGSKRGPIGGVRHTFSGKRLTHFAEKGGAIAAKENTVYVQGKMKGYFWNGEGGVKL